MSAYLDDIQGVREALQEEGQSMTLTKEVYNINTGALTSSTSTTDKGVILPFSNGIVALSGGLIKSSDQQVFINIAAIPELNDRLSVGVNVYSIVNVKALEPAGVNVLYELTVRL